ncbi:hypothetical protein KG892_00640 [Vermiphilus pyriformis]|jgi:hypothetical protein|nr:MAG: hypothetical protein KG892_00640 [Vermiphilus pyriformis]
MEHSKSHKPETDRLAYLLGIPRNMLTMHTVDNLTEFVLHDLCAQQGLNLNKAAYFIESPDFNHFKGVAGFSRPEAFPEQWSIWQHPQEFSRHMKGSEFNSKVRSIVKEGVKRTAQSEVDLTAELAQSLGIVRPRYCSWHTKHDNHAIFLYEANDTDVAIPHEHVSNGVCLLGFCPIF